MSEERVTETLRALRRADFDVEIDGEAEVRTLLKFRRQWRRRRLQRMALASAIAAGAAILALYRPPHQVAPAIIAAAVPAAPQPQAIEPQVAPKIKRVPRREPEEVVTPFFPLMASAPPLESALLVRMTVPASAMRNLGLPVGDDHLSDAVLADVLVGQDDLARAIRFVSYQ
jgi:hypothetical protein